MRAKQQQYTRAQLIGAMRAAFTSQIDIGNIVQLVDWTQEQVTYHVRYKVGEQIEIEQLFNAIEEARTLLQTKIAYGEQLINEQQQYINALKAIKAHRQNVRVGKGCFAIRIEHVNIINFQINGQFIVCNLCLSLMVDEKRVYVGKYQPSYNLAFAINQTFEFNDVRSRISIVFESDKQIPMHINKLEVPLASFQISNGSYVSETFTSADSRQLLELEISYQFLVQDAQRAQFACSQEIEVILQHTQTLIDELTDWKEQLFQISRLNIERLKHTLEANIIISEEFAVNDSARSNMFEPSERSFRTYAIKVPDYYKTPLVPTARMEEMPPEQVRFQLHEIAVPKILTYGLVITAFECLLDNYMLDLAIWVWLFMIAAMQLPSQPYLFVLCSIVLDIPRATDSTTIPMAIVQALLKLIAAYMLHPR